MKRTAVVIVGLGLLTSALVAPATAKKAAKPAATTLYLHGNYHVGDGAEFAGSLANSTHMMMDGTEPAAGAPKSMSYSTPIGNVECAGNPLFPSWDGKLAGKITSDVKIIGHFVSPG
ncbi:MAG: hypothetical protein M3273_05025, partial [Actinomycetota bacterium]|nr:hypothetical protein [Actinomycetota bacterium]